MVHTKALTLRLDGNGSYLGMEKGCFIVKDKYDHVERYPLFEKEIGEVILKSGNAVSTGALSSMGFWGIDVLVTTQRGRPVAMLKSLDDDSHVKTRLCQYEAVNNAKGVHIAKQFVLGKFHGQNVILEKYDFHPHDESYQTKIEQQHAEQMTPTLRRRLMAYESKFTKRYFDHIFRLFPESIRPKGRRTYQAYDGVNNLFNLAYEQLAWRVHRTLITAKLEPYLGFLHSTQYGKPSLVCDVQELYRYLVDDFLLQFCKELNTKDFIMKAEELTQKKLGKRVYLNDRLTRDFTRRLNTFFESYVTVTRIRVGQQQTIETLINEEALQFAKYLRNERNSWIPRIVMS